METTKGLGLRVYIGIMENNMDLGLLGLSLRLRLRAEGFGFRV